jgi:hypothetical protein
MRLEEHENNCLKVLGNKCTKVHIYLDQYFKYFRSEAHRVILHHEKGAHKIGHKFSYDYSYHIAYMAAVQHIREDLENKIIPEDWNDILPQVFFLCEQEFEDAENFLLIEFPMEFEGLSKKNLYY